MEIIQAIVLGIVQGLTEWLPVSSTAHLRVVPALIGWQDPGAAFTAAIQLGTMAAVLLYFGRDLWGILRGWIRGLRNSHERDTPEYKLGWGIFYGSLPIIVLGLLLKDLIETDFRSLGVISLCLILMGLVMLAADRLGKRYREISQASILDGVLIGLWQALALIPGVSRSGSTLSGAFFRGFDRASAARIAFVLSVPSVLGAGVYSLYSHRKELLGESLAPLLVANVFSFAVGYATIASFMQFLKKRGLTLFVVYRIVLGVILGILWLGDQLPNEPSQVEAGPSVAIK